MDNRSPYQLVMHGRRIYDQANKEPTGWGTTRDRDIGTVAAGLDDQEAAEVGRLFTRAPQLANILERLDQHFRFDKGANATSMITMLILHPEELPAIYREATALLKELKGAKR